MRRVRMALAAGLLLTLAALLAVLSGAPVTVAGTNGVNSRNKVGTTAGRVTICQSGGTLPRDVSAIRVSLSANTGPKVTVRVLSGLKLVTQGSRSADWGISETVTVPLKPLPHAVANVRICTVIGASPEGFEVKGVMAKGVAVLRVEYLRPGTTSWWSLAPSVAEHLGFGRVPSGSWVALLVIAGMLAVAAMTARLVLQELP
jgi:hypothetical protein